MVEGAPARASTTTSHSVNTVSRLCTAYCHDTYSAERVRKSNNAQIMTMGAQIIAPTLARVLVDHWLSSEFAGGRSTHKVEKIKAIEKRYHRRPEIVGVDPMCQPYGP